MIHLATLTDLDADVGDGEVEPPLEAALLADVKDLAVEGGGPRGHAVVAHYPAHANVNARDREIRGASKYSGAQIVLQIVVKQDPVRSRHQKESRNKLCTTSPHLN